MLYDEGFSRETLYALRATIESRIEGYKSMGLTLDMSRGKPCKAQLDLSNSMFQYMGQVQDETEPDYRNYGLLDGTKAAKQLFADILEVTPEQVLVGGNSSLVLMHDALVRAMLFGTVDSERPWGKEERIKFLCPSPGYDRHFTICEHLGFEMITIAMDDNGPDMDQVEAYAASDPLVKGIWCVPKYANPTGVVYSDAVVDRLAQMHTAAKDFRIFWDQAYVVHPLYDEDTPLKNIMTACEASGNSERVYQFTSTSKITFPGGGVSAMAASLKNMTWIRKQRTVQTIGANKLNMAMHTAFLKNMNGIRAHMKQHAACMRPKFQLVEEKFALRLGGKGIASWNHPKGGYFINLNVLPGTAKAVDHMAKSLGLILTPAGSTYPYGNDPLDQNIRIAPSYPELEELAIAMDVLCDCIEWIGINQKLNNR